MNRFTLTGIFVLVLLSVSCMQPKRHLVISKIKNSAKLATTETVIDKIVVGDKSRRILGIINVSNAEFVAYTQAFVKTGVDMTLLGKDDIRIKGNTIELKLPRVQVLDFRYPFDQFRIDPILSNDKLFNRVDVVEQEYFFRKAELDIREHLEYMGIIEQTEENTRKMMESLLLNLGFEEIYITFSDSGQFIPQVNLNPEDR